MLSQDDFIDQLNEAPSVRGFFALSTQQFVLQIELLIQRVFRKEDFALKSVVDSLFEHQGPLAELGVRLKLLLGLGVISAQVFEDISRFIEMKQQLSDLVEEPHFTQPLMLDFAQQLHHIDQHLIVSLFKKPVTENRDSMFYQMQQARLEKSVKSAMILAISTICEKLNVESPL